MIDKYEVYSRDGASTVIEEGEHHFCYSSLNRFTVRTNDEIIMFISMWINSSKEVGPGEDDV